MKIDKIFDPLFEYNKIILIKILPFELFRVTAI